MERKLDDDDQVSTPEPPTAPSRFDRASHLGSRLKAGAKRLLDQNDDQGSTDSDDASDIFEDVAFNPQQVDAAHPHEKGSLRDKLHRGAHTVAVTVKNPRRAMRSKYARTLAGNVSGQTAGYERRYDEELVEAHDALQHANSRAGLAPGEPGDSDTEHENSDSVNDDSDVTDHDVQEAKAKFRKIEAKRRSLRMAWILGRHVRRAQVASPMKYPFEKSNFTETTTDGQAQVRWAEYLAQKVLWQTRGFTASYIDDFDELPFDLKELSLTIERLAIVSAPWQNFLLDVREVYLWNDPKRTSKYLIIYTLLWYFQHIMTAGLAWIIFSTINNKLNPTKVETIRRKILRSKDDQARAQAWGELIQRHGQHDWIEPLLDQCGPLLQLELSDMSNILEIFQNFYRWERPDKTISTLFFLAVCLLVSLLADTAFCVRIIWLGVGYTFFVGFPLAAKFPKYRRLVQPVYWIFWDIPNLSELAVMHLQEKAIVRDASRLDKLKAAESWSEVPDFSGSDSDTNINENGNTLDKGNKPSSRNVNILRTIRDTDQVTFRAVHSTHQTHGRLRIHRTGFWYYDKLNQTFYPYTRLLEIRKVDISNANHSETSKMARLARRIQESTSLQFLPSGLEFFFTPASPTPTSVTATASPSKEHEGGEKDETLALTVSESDRDKIFSLILSWSNLKWRPLCSLNKRNRLSEGAESVSKHGKGNKDLDDAIKSFVHGD